MSTLALGAISDFKCFYPRNNGISEYSKNLEREIEKANSAFLETFTFGWKTDIRDEIQEVAIECSSADWDGYGATPVSLGEAKIAYLFLQMLPQNIEPPEVSPDPDGAISFNWGNGYNQIFSISVEENLLIYAGLFNDGVKKHGQLPYYDEIPSEISDILSRYFRQI